MRARATPSKREWRELASLHQDLLAAEAEIARLKGALRELGAINVLAGQDAIKRADASSRPAAPIDRPPPAP